MARLDPKDVQLWLTLIQAAAPGIATAAQFGVAGIKGLIALFRRTDGQPEEKPGDDALAADILAQVVETEKALTSAQKPWATIEDTADEELKNRLKQGL